MKANVPTHECKTKLHILNREKKAGSLFSMLSPSPSCLILSIDPLKKNKFVWNINGMYVWSTWLPDLATHPLQILNTYTVLLHSLSPCIIQITYHFICLISFYSLKCCCHFCFASFFLFVFCFKNKINAGLTTMNDSKYLFFL